MRFWETRQGSRKPTGSFLHGAGGIESTLQQRHVQFDPSEKIVGDDRVSPVFVTFHNLKDRVLAHKIPFARS